MAVKAALHNTRCVNVMELDTGVDTKVLWAWAFYALDILSTRIPNVSVSIDEGEVELEISDDPYDCCRLDIKNIPLIVTLNKVWAVINSFGSNQNNLPMQPHNRHYYITLSEDFVHQEIVSLWIATKSLYSFSLSCKVTSFGWIVFARLTMILLWMQLWKKSFVVMVNYWLL